MRDIRRDIAELARSLERIPHKNGGRQVMVIGTDPEEQTEDVASSLAVLLTGRSRRATWLIDLDLLGNGLYRDFQTRDFSRMGSLGRALDASLKTTPFFHIVPQMRAVAGKTRRDPKYLAARQVGNTRLYLTEFREELLKQGQKVQINSSGQYWHALRNVADWTVVNALSLEESRTGLAVCRHMDGVILVVSADETRVDDINALRDEIEAHGGHCLGVVVNGVKADARFADRFAF